MYEIISYTLSKQLINSVSRAYCGNEEVIFLNLINLTTT